MIVEEPYFVSVIIPVYNSEKSIICCLTSVVCQTYKNFEIIIVDDGSEDSSSAIVNEFIKKENDINIILVKQKNSGPSVARNNGIKKAKGKYIAFLDSDDEWYPEKLDRIIAEFKKNDDLYILSSLYSIGNRLIKNNTTESLKYISTINLLLKNSLLTSGVVCKKELFEKFQFNEKQKYSEDYRLWLEIVSSGYKCAILNEYLLKMNGKPTYGASGLSSNLWMMEKGELDNYLHLYNIGNINCLYFIFATVFSLIKYSRRAIIVKMRKTFLYKF